jgi:hypothetical protein
LTNVAFFDDFDSPKSMKLSSLSLIAFFPFLAEVFPLIDAPTAAKGCRGSVDGGLGMASTLLKFSIPHCSLSPPLSLVSS